MSSTPFTSLPGGTAPAGASSSAASSGGGVFSGLKARWARARVFQETSRVVQEREVGGPLSTVSYMPPPPPPPTMKYVAHTHVVGTLGL